jgi:hypothetical protein
MEKKKKQKELEKEKRKQCAILIQNNQGPLNIVDQASPLGYAVEEL